MKALVIFLCIFLLTGCSAEKSVIDTDECDGIKAVILSDDGAYGSEISIEKGEDSFVIDVEGMNPWRLDFCNVDGGEIELAIGVYKETPLHPVMAKRVFFYNIDFENERLKPKLRISRLNNPMADFSVYDIDGDGWDEILSVEEKSNGRYEIGVYKWTNFSFEKVFFSSELEEEVCFADKENTIEIDGELKNLYLKGGRVLWQDVKY